LWAEPSADEENENPPNSAQPSSSRYQSKNGPAAQANAAEASSSAPNLGACLTRSDKDDMWELGAKTNYDYIKRVEETVELSKTPIGMALKEKELLRGFKHFGLNFTCKYDAHSFSSSSESSVDEIGAQEMDVDEMRIDSTESMLPEVKTRVTGPYSKAPGNITTTSSQLDTPPNSGLAISNPRQCAG
jgi:hypothetical protein